MQLVHIGWRIREIREAIRTRQPVGEAITNMPTNVTSLVSAGPFTARPSAEDDWEYEAGRLTMFVRRVASTHPHFTYYVIRSRTIGFGEEVEHVLVMKDQEPIGEIQLESYGSTSLQFENRRVAKATQRKNFRATANFKAANKLFKNYFFGVTVQEKADELVRTVGKEMRTFSNQLDTKKRQAVRNLMAAIEKNIHLPAVDDLLEVLGFAPSTLAEATLDLNVAEDMCKSSTEGMNVAITSAGYLIETHKAAAPYVVANENLTPGMRQALGLLKLCEVGTFVPGAGFKAAHDQFYLTEEATNGGA
tara:strand:+ start:481 stop:1395 length:915 start_codon:yes stop_codon:yes gene_type:complete